MFCFFYHCKVGDVFIAENCAKDCECKKGGVMQCTNLTCDDDATCYRYVSSELI